MVHNILKEFNVQILKLLEYKNTLVPPLLLKYPLKIESPITIKKSEENPAYLRSVVEHQLSSLDDYIKIYTDASKITDGVDCAIVTPKGIKHIKLSNEFTIFSAEAFAIKKAMKYISETEGSKFIIVTDSKSSINAIKHSSTYAKHN